MRIIRCLLLVSGCLSCGGESTTQPNVGDSGSTTYDAAALCAQLEARDTSCDAGTSATGCQWLTCYGTMMNTADALELAQCISTRACGVSDDSCFSAAGQKYASDPASQAFQTSCFDKRLGCKEAGTGFSDDYCPGYFYGMMKDKSAMDGCLLQPCEQVASCFKAIVSSAGCPN